MKTIEAKDLYNLRTKSGNVSLTNNGDIFFSYKVRLPEIYSLSENDYDEITNDLFRFEKALPIGTIQQWQAFSFNKEYDVKNLKESTFLQKSTKEYYRGKKFNDYNTYMYIIIPFNKKLYSNFSLNALREKTQNITREIEDIYNKQKSIDNAIAILNSSKYLKADKIDEIEIENIVINLITGFQPGKFTDMDFSPFKIGSNYFNCHALSSLKNFSQKTSNCKKDSKMSNEKAKFYKCFMHSLGIELPHNHILNIFIFNEGHLEIKKELQSVANEYSTFSAFSSTLEHGKEILDEYLRKIERNENIRLCRAHFNIFTFDKSKDKLDEIEADVEAAFSELDIKPYNPIVDDNIAYYLCSIPGNAGFFPRNETFLTDLQQALCLIPITGNYIEDAKGILLNDRLNNKPIIKDLWDKPYEDKIISARNFAVVAETGGGKSFTTTHMYRTYIEEDYSLVLLDIGESNESLAKLYPEKVNYIKFKEGQPIGINPFFVKSHEELTSEKIQSLNDFIAIHWKKETGLDDNTRVSLNYIIEDYYRNCQERNSFPSFYNYVKKESHQLLRRLEINPIFFDIEEFLHVCSEYVDGIYDFLYADSEEGIMIGDKPCIFFELSNILDNPVIFPIMTLMIKDAIDTKIWKNSGRPKVLVYEETAKIIKFPGQLKAIDYTAQTVRKYEGAMGLVIQTIDNIPENEIGKAILNNIHTYFIFEQQKGLNSLIAKLNLHEHAVNQIKSIKSNLAGKNKYTEFGILQGTRINCYRFEAPKQVYYAYVSDKDQKIPLYEEYEKTGSFEEAIINTIEHEI